MKLLTLDPSVNNVGYSLFDSDAPTKKKAWKFGTWKLEGLNLEMRIMDLCHRIINDIGEFDYLCTERPAFFSSEKGNIAAHMNYTIDLAAVAYFVAGWFHMDHRKHLAITATQWKGQVSKVITARRFFRSFPSVHAGTLDEHAIDAVMLGKFAFETYILTKHPFKNNTRALKLL